MPLLKPFSSVKLWKADIKKKKKTNASLNGFISKTKRIFNSRLRFPEISFNFI